jgi:hypothetical protein
MKSTKFIVVQRFFSDESNINKNDCEVVGSFSSKLAAASFLEEIITDWIASKNGNGIRKMDWVTIPECKDERGVFHEKKKYFKYPFLFNCKERDIIYKSFWSKIKKDQAFVVRSPNLIDKFVIYDKKKSEGYVYNTYYPNKLFSIEICKYKKVCNHCFIDYENIEFSYEEVFDCVLEELSNCFSDRFKKSFNNVLSELLHYFEEKNNKS